MSWPFTASQDGTETRDLMPPSPLRAAALSFLATFAAASVLITAFIASRFSLLRYPLSLIPYPLSLGACLVTSVCGRMSAEH